MSSERFRTAAGLCAVLAGTAGFCYSVAFVLVARAQPALGAGLSGGLLLAGALLAVPVGIALHAALMPRGPELATLALALWLLGAAGAALHGGYDLAVALHPPAGAASTAPSQADPRGLATFGLSGAAVLLFSRLLAQASWSPAGLVRLGALSGVLLLLIYLARLVILDPANPAVLAPAAVEGFVLNPLWYLWLGVALRRPSGALRPAPAAA